MTGVEEEPGWLDDLDGGVEQVDWVAGERAKLDEDVGRIAGIGTLEELAALRERIAAALDGIHAAIATWREQVSHGAKPDYRWFNRATYRVNQFDRAIRRVDWRHRMLSRDGILSSKELAASVPAMGRGELDGLYARTLERYRGIHAERKVAAVLPDRDEGVLRKHDGMLLHLRGLMVAIRREIEERSKDIEENPWQGAAEALARRAEAERARAEAHLEATRLQQQHAMAREEAKTRRTGSLEAVMIGLIRERGLLDEETLRGLSREAKNRVKEAAAISGEGL